MQDKYWQKFEQCLSADRLGAYGQDQSGHRVVTARYLWNIAVSESLYAPLHLLEVGLRNAIDRAMVDATGSDTWYDQVALPSWCHAKIGEAKAGLVRCGKDVLPGRVIAELQFGFWTAMFQSEFERPSAGFLPRGASGSGSSSQAFERPSAGFLPRGIKATFPHMPKSLHNRKQIKAKLDEIRSLRNRIFHHERIIHWKDLPQKYELILKFIGWINPDLAELARIVETFPAVQAGGTQPFLDRLDGHWAAVVKEAAS